MRKHGSAGGRACVPPSASEPPLPARSPQRRKGGGGARWGSGSPVAEHRGVALAAGPHGGGLHPPVAPVQVGSLALSQHVLVRVQGVRVLVRAGRQGPDGAQRRGGDGGEAGVHLPGGPPADEDGAAARPVHEHARGAAARHVQLALPGGGGPGAEEVVQIRHAACAAGGPAGLARAAGPARRGGAAAHPARRRAVHHAARAGGPVLRGAPLVQAVVMQVQPSQDRDPAVGERQHAEVRPGHARVGDLLPLVELHAVDRRVDASLMAPHALLQVDCPGAGHEDGAGDLDRRGVLERVAHRCHLLPAARPRAQDLARGQGDLLVAAPRPRDAAQAEQLAVHLHERAPGPGGPQGGQVGPHTRTGIEDLAGRQRDGAGRAPAGSEAHALPAAVAVAPPGAPVEHARPHARAAPGHGEAPAERGPRAEGARPEVGPRAWHRGRPLEPLPAVEVEHLDLHHRPQRAVAQLPRQAPQHVDEGLGQKFLDRLRGPRRQRVRRGVRAQPWVGGHQQRQQRCTQAGWLSPRGVPLYTRLPGSPSLEVVHEVVHGGGWKLEISVQAVRSGGRGDELRQRARQAQTCGRARDVDVGLGESVLWAVTTPARRWVPRLSAEEAPPARCWGASSGAGLGDWGVPEDAADGPAAVAPADPAESVEPPAAPAHQA
eukprot:CAMPEP_0179234514 /NCGR_PEP_ID=MMETSP0797-20121207/12932_1 /TAXON_ID=47934 /ORGANISM="Dinophysis acuminata, Strain DAEP01" /LENGTH=659 /DNA_ID=CAMNT_0020941703 /DNA_START=217 /DNA_END=2192 /DNA_ORIENTATION=+